MKKTFTILSLLLVCLVGVSMWSCSDDDKEEPLFDSQLPENAKTFLNTYYNGIQVLSVDKDTDHGTTTYDAALANGHKIEFSATGEWISVDAPTGQTVPAGIVPEAITTYVNSNYAGQGINEISRESYGYEVELLNGLDLHFTTTGDFISAENQ